MLEVTATSIDDATRRLDGIVRRTPLEYNERLSRLTGSQVWLKREDLQLVRSYKLRGAFNFIAQEQAVARAAGVVCASAGNHAQGVAWACRELGVVGQIFIPRTTPRQKRGRIRSIGGDLVEVVVGGETYDDAQRQAQAYADQTGALLVPAFDAPPVIAGQGTVATEVAEQLGRAPDRIVVPVGGEKVMQMTVTLAG